jgi:hypothetical protein
MRKIKSTALLGAFVAVASVGVISHEAHGTTVGTNGTAIISKEILPDNTVNLQASIIPNVGFSNSSITLTISGASFSGGNDSYTIASCTSVTTGTALSLTNSLTFNDCTLSANTAYAITGPSSDGNPYFSVSVPQSSSSIVLSYSSNVIGDTAASDSIAQVQQQLSFAPISSSTYYINPSSMSTFTNNNNASNSVVLSNSAYNNTWSNTISNISMTFVFTGIPSSVSGVTASDNNNNTWNYSSTSIVNGSFTAYSTLNTSKPPFQSASSDTITFTFSNSSNVSISTGTISLSSITGVTSSTSYVYLSTPQNFLTFTLGATQIYVPDALAPDNNVIQYSYLTISMPQGATISSISVLNTGVSCSASSISLISTSTPGVYYMPLSQLVQACSTSITPIAWQSGVPLVMTISGSNVGPNTVTADAYAVFGGMLKRIPVNVVAGNSTAQFSY